MLSDFIVCILVILLVYYGATNLIHDEKTQRFMGILAGIVLIVFGAFHFKAPVPKSADSIEIKAPSASLMVLKGFFLNSLNPTVYLLWLGNVTTVGKTLDYSVVKMIVYFGLTLGIVLLVEFAKVHAAGKLKRILTPVLMHRVNMITGVLLIVCGLVIIYNHYF